MSNLSDVDCRERHDIDIDDSCQYIDTDIANVVSRTMKMLYKRVRAIVGNL